LEGAPERRLVGALERWPEGAPERWLEGALERWLVGAPERFFDLLAGRPSFPLGLRSGREPFSPLV
jgi:hypothetical protein